METTEKTVEQAVQEFLKSRGIEYKFTFQPQNYAEVDAKCKSYRDYMDLCYKWKVTVNGEEFPYFTGLGHQGLTANTPNSLKVADAEKIKWAVCGKKYNPVTGSTPTLKLKNPKIADVLYCLLMDSSCTEYTFPEWCDNFEQNPDSISALEMYRQCGKTGRQLDNIFSSADLDILREMFQDY